MKSTTSEPIPLAVPYLAGNEWAYVKACLDSQWVSSAGQYVEAFEAAVARYTGARYAVATASGTAALHLSLRLAGVQAGEAVLVPNLTFVASVNAIRYLGGEPILLDVDPDTWQMDLDLLANFLAEETYLAAGGCYLRGTRQRIRALLPVHVLGHLGDLPRLMALAEAHHLAVVEDATEALGSRWQGRHAGTFGSLGCFSFNGNKVITTGGGGMVITDDPELARQARHLSTQAKVSPEAYQHDAVGYNYRLVNPLAAMGLAQMEQLPTILQRKQAIDRYYRSSLADLPGVSFQQVPPGATPNHWLFTLQVPDQGRVLQALQQQAIQARPLWVPMNQLPMFASARYVSGQDQARALHAHGVSLPSSASITEAALARVTRVLRAALRG